MKIVGCMDTVSRITVLKYKKQFEHVLNSYYVQKCYNLNIFKIIFNYYIICKKVFGRILYWVSYWLKFESCY